MLPIFRGIVVEGRCSRPVKPFVAGEEGATSIRGYDKSLNGGLVKKIILDLMPPPGISRRRQVPPTCLSLR